jgi:predicted DNA-binding protein (MmcQ/YjbR family)
MPYLLITQKKADLSLKTLSLNYESNGEHMSTDHHPLFNWLKDYVLNKPETLLDFPFGDDVYVFKVKNKMFALLGYRNDQLSLNLKCDPSEALMLRDIFPAITTGYHMDKKHWNTIFIDGSVPKGEMERMIDNSFKLVVSKMTKKDQVSISIHL